MKRTKISRFTTIVLTITLLLSFVTSFDLPNSASAQGFPNRNQLQASGVRSSLDLSALTAPDALTVVNGRVRVFLKLSQSPIALAYAGGGQNPSVVAAQRVAVSNEQQTVAAQLPSLGANAVVLGKLSVIANGLSVEMDAAKIKELAKLPNVVAVYPDFEITRDLSTSIPSIGVPYGWDHGYTGEGMRIAVIDDGIDYKHADFGGNASTTWNPATGATDKVVAGYDLVGDSYQFGLPQAPDPDPLTCPPSVAGDPTHHGTHVAGIALGYGVNADGTTYHGPYNASTNLGVMKIAPGVAPDATLYAYRVFGCFGSTSSEIVASAIERAVDPNGDGDPSDAVEVINMSLGSSYGSGFGVYQEAIDNAVAAGVIVVASAGNSGDSYYTAGNPSVVGSAISVANTTAYNPEVVVGAPSSIAGTYYAAGAAFGPRFDTVGLSGTLASAVPNIACSALTSVVAGKIAVIDRGTCTFANKVYNAQLAGATGALVCNNAAGAPIVMGGDPLFPNITIPSVMLSQADCNRIKPQIASGTVTLTIRVGASSVGIDPSSSRGPRRNSDGSGIILKPDVAAPGANIFSAAGNGGSAGKSLSGTSMAAPHVAGIVALLKEQNPFWSVAEIKALLMNTSIVDVKPNPASLIQYGPGRVGTGRVDVANAVNEGGIGPRVIAYDKNAPLLVSLSFGLIEATGPTTVTRTIELKNKGKQAVTYNVGLQNVVQQNGTTVSVSPNVITVPANGKASVSVTINTNPGAFTQSFKHDATVDEAQGGLLREWLSEVAGYVTFTAASKPSLRVAYHAVPRPAASMHAASDTLVLPSATGSASIPLVGNGVFTGPVSGAGSQYNVLSTVSPFELKYISGDEINETPLSNDADVKYVGITSDFGAHGTLASSEIYFAIATQSDFGTMKQLQIRIWIDKNSDGVDDFLLDVPNLTVSNLPVDVFLSRLTPLSGTGGGFYDYPGPVYAGGSFPINTYRLNSNVIVLAVSAGPGWLNLTNGVPFKFQVDVQSVDGADLTPYLTYNPAAAPLDFTGASVGGPFPFLPWYVDFAGADDVPVSYNLANFSGEDPLRILLVHYQNAAGKRTDVVTVKGPGLPGLPNDTIGIYRASAGQFQMRKTNTGGAPEITVNFGQIGKVSQNKRYAVSGDWNGDGIDTVGYYETWNARFVLTNSSDGSGPQIIVPFGVSGDLPIVGDWDGDGVDGIGVHRPSDGTFYLRDSATAGAADYVIHQWLLQGVGVAGDWNGDGYDTVGLYRSGKFYQTDGLCLNCLIEFERVVTFAGANANDVPVIGDWDGDGYSGLGVYRTSTGTFSLRNNALSGGAADLTIPFGMPGDQPIAGKWVDTSAGAVELAPGFTPKN
ncbi:MAG: S8 family serine peptidase [Anaerolineae bacterium]|nr:S8 family serine peptidase [Anaerolineae bacterium]